MPTSAESESIFLTGFMGSGKTTLGKLAAAQLELIFFDLDEEIELRTQQTLAEHFVHSEPYFREQEHRILLELLSETGEQPCLIALGGGTSIHSVNQPLIPPERIIFLDVPFPVLEQRLAACTHRPLAHDPRGVKRLHEQRIPLYSQAAITLALSAEDDLMRATDKLIVCLRELLWDMAWGIGCGGLCRVRWVGQSF